MHLFTMTTNGNILDLSGNVVARLSDDSHISDFLLGVRAAFDAMGREIRGEIIRDGDWQAWEAAAVKRIKAANTCDSCHKPMVRSRGEFNCCECS